MHLSCKQVLKTIYNCIEVACTVVLASVEACMLCLRWPVICIELSKERRCARPLLVHNLQDPAASDLSCGHLS